MDDGYALLRAIEAEPDEDTPRLAYADWLDEHATTDADRARAELIRVQCALVREPPGDRKAALAVREHQLLQAHVQTWKSLYPLHIPGRTGYLRGFVHLSLRAADFVTHGEALAAVTPVHQLRLHRVAGVAAELAACPVLRRVRNLSLESSGLRNLHLSALTASPHLANVRLLGLNYNHIGAAGGAALAPAALPALRVLTLNGNPVKDRGFLALARADWFANLVGLHASFCEVSDDAVIRLAGLPAASNLRSLDVGGQDRGDDAARAILDSPHLSRLRRLWFPERDLSVAIRAALRDRFGGQLNLTSYRYD